MTDTDTAAADTKKEWTYTAPTDDSCGSGFVFYNAEGCADTAKVAGAKLTPDEVKKGVAIEYMPAEGGTAAPKGVKSCDKTSLKLNVGKTVSGGTDYDAAATEGDDANQIAVAFTED